MESSSAAPGRLHRADAVTSRFVGSEARRCVMVVNPRRHSGSAAQGRSPGTASGFGTTRYFSPVACFLVCLNSSGSSIPASDTSPV